MSYPSTLTSFTNPQPTDRLNAPSHSSIETAQNTGLSEIQTFVGTLASTAGTLIYDIRSPNSNGGGHVQTAVLGGTGQTSFTKGDILAGQSNSTLSRLAVGVDGQILSADSTKATGITWIDNSRTKLYTSTSIIGTVGGETSIYSVTVPGSTLGTTNALRSTTQLVQWTTSPGSSILAVAQYGNGNSSSILMAQDAGGGGFGMGQFIHTIISSTVGIQKHFLEFNGWIQPGTVNGPFGFSIGSVTATNVRNWVTTTTSVESSANQTLGLTINTANVGGAILRTGGVIIEKITS